MCQCPLYTQQLDLLLLKRIIAVIWQDPEDKVKRDSLLLEYHNLRQLVVNSNKEIISEPQEESTRIEVEAGPSSSSWRSPEEIDNARRELNHLKSEELKAAAGQDEGLQEDEDLKNELDNDEQDNEPQEEENNPATEQARGTNAAANEDRHYIIPEHSEDAVRSNEAEDRYCLEPFDLNVTRIPRNLSANNQEQVRATSHTPNNSTTQDVRNHQPTSSNTMNNSIIELVSVMTKLLEKMSQNQDGHNNQSPNSSSSSWNDTKDTRRKARKAFASQFAKKTFSGTFGEN